MELPVGKTPATASRRGAWLAAALILATALAAYWNSFHVPLLMDDDVAIVKNSTIRHLWPLRDVLFPAAHPGPTSGRPILNLSYALNYAWSGEQVFSYHLVNFGLHVLVALVLFGVVRRTLLLPRLQAHFAPAADYLAAAVVVLWTVHPLQTEAVTYVSQRAEMLMALCYLLTLYCFLRAAAPAGSRSSAKWWYAGSVACCWLGMTAKEVMVTAPFVVLVFDAIFLAGSVGQAARTRRLFYTGLAASWIFLAWLMITFSQRTVGFHQGISPWNYALTECQAVVHYVRLIFWPYPLVFDFGPATTTSLSNVLPWAFVLLLLLAGTLIALWRSPAAGFLGLCFFVILAPTSSIVPVALQPIAESRLYLPLAAILTGVVLGAYRLLDRRAFWLLLPVALIAIVGTVLRNDDYRTELSLWTDTVAQRPDNPRAQDNLGSALARAGRTTEAIPHFLRALELAPNVSRIHYNLGKALHDTGQHDAAIPEYEAALRLEPTYADAEINLATALAETGRETQAQAHLQRALQLSSDDPVGHYNLGLALLRRGRAAESIREFKQALQLNPHASEFHDALATAFFQVGQTDEAVSQYEQALREQPDFAAAHHNLGNALFALGRGAEARAQFERALQLKPDYSQAMTSLGVLELQEGAVDKARGLFEKALQLDRSDAEAHFRLGNIFAMGGQLPAALMEWQETVRLRPDDAEAHNNLAIALSQAGRIPEAIHHYEEALRLKPDYERARNNLAELRAQQTSAAGK